MTGKTIVVAFDFTPNSIAALQYAVQFAETTKSDIEVLYVIEDSASLNRMLNKSEDATADKMLNENFYECIKDVLPYEREIFFRVLRGKVYSEMVSYLKNRDILFLCCGMNSTEDGSDIAEIYVGSNAQRIMSHAEFPVLIHKNEVKFGEVKQVIIPIERNTELNNLNGYVEICKSIGAKKIYLLHVVDNIDDYTLNKNLINLNDYKEQLEKSGISIFAELLKFGKSNHDYGMALDDYIRRSDADLILLPNKKLKGLNDLSGNALNLQICNLTNLPLISYNS